MNAAVTGCTSDFTTGTIALLKGLARHHPDVTRYCFTIPEQVVAVQATLGSLATVLPIPRLLTNAPGEAKIRVSWSRVFIPTLPADVVAWFDSDVILCRDAAAWWQVPPGKVNMVQDAAYCIKHMVPLGLEEWYFQHFALQPNAPGFNAGVFALRPADWPDLPECFEALLADHDLARQPFAFDQGLLNGLLHTRANWLPREYNAHCLAECGVPAGVRVLHYTGSPKPWAAGYDHATRAYEYWLMHGEGVTDPAILSNVRWQRRQAAPQRLLNRGLRKLLHVLGRRPAMGVGKKPE